VPLKKKIQVRRLSQKPTSSACYKTNIKCQSLFTPYILQEVVCILSVIYGFEFVRYAQVSQRQRRITEKKNIKNPKNKTKTRSKIQR
jgi:hypothetical protein